MQQVRNNTALFILDKQLRRNPCYRDRRARYLWMRITIRNVKKEQLVEIAYSRIHASPTSLVLEPLPCNARSPSSNQHSSEIGIARPIGWNRQELYGVRALEASKWNEALEFVSRGNSFCNELSSKASSPRRRVKHASKRSVA